MNACGGYQDNVVLQNSFSFRAMGSPIIREDVHRVFSVHEASDKEGEF